MMAMDSPAIAQMPGLVLKLFALMTPTAVLCAFIYYTRSDNQRARFVIAGKTAVAIFATGEVLYLFGSHIFSMFGFTVDAFRIGVGVLLFLSAVNLMNNDNECLPLPKPDMDISVVPLAIPLGMGPSTIGAIMIMGASAKGSGDLLIGSICILLAAILMALFLCLSSRIQKLIGDTGITILSKLTALILSAIAAQVIFTGIRHFLKHQA